jgi:hypothetical protein
MDRAALPGGLRRAGVRPPADGRTLQVRQLWRSVLNNYSEVMDSLSSKYETRKPGVSKAAAVLFRALDALSKKPQRLL